MNLSGEALKEFLKDKDIIDFNNKNLVVVHDDLDLESGRIKLKYNSGPGGHRGISSIINTLGYKNFFRVKVGIGKPESGNISDYVLEKFSLGEKIIINDSVKKAGYLSILLGLYQDISKVSVFLKNF